MKTSKEKFNGARYYDDFNGLYLSELPDEYYEEDGIIYIKGTGDNFDVESSEISLLR